MKSNENEVLVTKFIEDFKAVNNGYATTNGLAKYITEEQNRIDDIKKKINFWKLSQITLKAEYETKIANLKQNITDVQKKCKHEIDNQLLSRPIGK